MFLNEWFKTVCSKWNPLWIWFVHPASAPDTWLDLYLGFGGHVSTLNSVFSFLKHWTCLTLLFSHCILPPHSDFCSWFYFFDHSYLMSLTGSYILTIVSYFVCCSSSKSKLLLSLFSRCHSSIQWHDKLPNAGNEATLHCWIWFL